jgi:cysteine desulfurase
MSRVYADHNATAPLRPAARDAMLAVLDAPGNASSAHREGARARRLVEEARAEVAALVGGAPAEIVFTSGATEANNLALRGLRHRGPIVTTTIEHASVLETVRALDGTATIRVDGDGRVAVADVVAACDDTVGLASVALANGEVGSVAPITAIAPALRANGIMCHTDAAQAAGRLPIDVRALGVDALSVSSHKLGGPLGAGALWVRSGCPLTAQSTGGPQERGRRAGTENVAAIVGFGVAARIARLEVDAEATRLAALTEALWSGIWARIPDAVRNGPSTGPRLPNTLNVGFPGVPGESLLVRLDLDGIAASLGSACAAGAAEPSHVLRAMGRDADAARGGLRLSLGWNSTAADVARLIEVVPAAVVAVRARSAA